jgi:hypothetical protein
MNDTVFRIRRGRRVQVPPKWVGKMTTRKTIRQRPSNFKHKLRKALRFSRKQSLAAAREEINRRELLEEAT